MHTPHWPPRVPVGLVNRVECCLGVKDETRRRLAVWDQRYAGMAALTSVLQYGTILTGTKDIDSNPLLKGTFPDSSEIPLGCPQQSRVDHGTSFWSRHTAFAKVRTSIGKE